MTDLRMLAQKIEPAFVRPVLGMLVSRVLPDLTRFDVKTQVSHASADHLVLHGLSAFSMRLELHAVRADRGLRDPFSRRDL